MDIKRLLRISSIIFLAVILMTGLASCRLAASDGPEATEAEEFPIPGDTEQAPQVETVPTATAQAGQAEATAAVVEAATQPVAITETPEPPSPTSAKPVYVKATPGIPSQYVLKAGEFPFCIARRFDVNQYELLAINGLSLKSYTYVGMTLKIPQTGNHFDGDPSLKGHPAEYTVKAGDTLEVIACKFGDVSPEMIALQNDLKSPYKLTAGQVLIIP